MNHLANMLLVLLLTPTVSKAKGRIVVVASDVHFWATLSHEDPHPVQTALESYGGMNEGRAQCS